MTDDEQKPGDQEATKVPSKEVTVPDATHTRFRKPMCRCSDEGHGTFALNNLHDHFTKFNHKSESSCVLCGGNEVYVYYLFTMDRHKMKIYHNCSSSKDKKTTPVPTDLRTTSVSSTAQAISQSSEVSDAESGIGTGHSSMVSIINGCNSDGQSTGGSPNKSSHSMSNSLQGKKNSPSSSHKNNK